MARLVTPLEALGQRVARGLDAYSGERRGAVDTAEHNFLQAALRYPAANRRRPRLIALIAAAVVAVSVAGLTVIRGPRPLAFTADGQVGTVQTWVAAPAERAVPLRFSDGTTLHVEPASRARVIALDGHGASVALENGALRADVVHTPESAWRVIAGPLTVRVTGTRFELRWSALTEEFLVSVKQGSVAVAGSVVGAEHAVRAGETLRVFVGRRRLELTNDLGMANDTDSSRSRAGAGSLPPAEITSSQVARETAVSKPAPASSSRPLQSQDDWRELARRGSLRKAFSLAEAAGFEAACQTASATELLQLGDAARLSGRPDRANQALLTLRKRYPSDPRRAAAAFALGKVAFDQTHAYAQAAQWFSISIREQPGGSLTREASGRLVEALQRSGDERGARRAAEDYLKRYPNGPHADVARSILR